MAAAKSLRLRKALPLLRQMLRQLRRMMRLPPMNRPVSTKIQASAALPPQRRPPQTLPPKIARQMTPPMPKQLRLMTAQTRHLILPPPRCRSLLRTIRRSALLQTSLLQTPSLLPSHPPSDLQYSLPLYFLRRTVLPVFLLPAFLLQTVRRFPPSPDSLRPRFPCRLPAKRFPLSRSPPHPPFPRDFFLPHRLRIRAAAQARSAR